MISKGIHRFNWKSVTMNFIGTLNTLGKNTSNDKEELTMAVNPSRFDITSG
jgi:curli biogenesis system outer membrane secretion channel CsgG